MTELSRGSISPQIEHQPQHPYSISTQHTSRTKSKKVRISQYSTCRVYLAEPYYEKQKSYTSQDQKIFRKEAASDAFRIKQLVMSSSSPPGLAFRQLMKQGLLSRKELLGIEHLVSINAKKELRERRSYIESVLDAQKEMRSRNDDKVDVEMLAAVAVPKSAGMIEKARLRAALAV